MNDDAKCFSCNLQVNLPKYIGFKSFSWIGNWRKILIMLVLIGKWKFFDEGENFQSEIEDYFVLQLKFWRWSLRKRKFEMFTFIFIPHVSNFEFSLILSTVRIQRDEMDKTTFSLRQNDANKKKTIWHLNFSINPTSFTIFTALKWKNSEAQTFQWNKKINFEQFPSDVNSFHLQPFILSLWAIDVAHFR